MRVCVCMYVYARHHRREFIYRSSGLDQVEGHGRSAHIFICQKVKEVKDPFIEHMLELEI